MSDNLNELDEVFRMSLLIEGTLVAECRASEAANGIMITTQIFANDRYTEELRVVCENLSGAITGMLNKVADGETSTWMSYHPNENDAPPDFPF